MVPSMTQTDHRGDRLVVGQQQGQHGPALRELVAAVGSAGRADRVAKVPQPVDVPPQGRRAEGGGQGTASLARIRTLWPRPLSCLPPGSPSISSPAGF